MIHETICLYPDRTDVTLTTYVNELTRFEAPGARKPAILICPGGAYLICASNEAEPVAGAFFAGGFQTFVLNYSVYSEGSGQFPDLRYEILPKEHCQFPKPMQDIARAMELLQENADKWLLDPEQIFLCGFSAGGHNAGMYSVSWAKEGMPKPCGTILGYPVADFYEEMQNPQKDPMMEAMSIAMVGKKTMSAEDLHATSIIENIDENTPPMFLWNTASDKMVNPTQTLRLATALIEHGIRTEVHTFERGRHSLAVANESSAFEATGVRPDLAVWVELAKTWMHKHADWKWED